MYSSFPAIVAITRQVPLLPVESAPEVIEQPTADPPLVTVNVTEPAVVPPLAVKVVGVPSVPVVEVTVSALWLAFPTVKATALEFVTDHRLPIERKAEA